jgi:hypothetical protein
VPEDPTFSIIRVNDTTTWVIKIPGIRDNLPLLCLLAARLGSEGHVDLCRSIIDRTQAREILDESWYD